jgi:predicted PurR-regulated permease PerM
MDILGKVDEAVGGFLRGQLIAAAIVGVLTAVGLAAIGMWRYALLVGVVAGVGHLIPYLGPVLGATPALLWSFLAPSHTTWGERFLYAGLVIALFVVIELVDGFFSQPRIVGKKSHLHPLVVIAALVIGAQFGITGIVLAVPSAAIARVLIKELWWNEHVARKKAAWRGGRDAGKAVQ